ncbi:ABC transporter substrate-binding protein [Roseomonas sp. PWR1]|uniref:ABC transporter substrate-binding protein n=1 Tax=Roseomonas nitratireducens TaxID=2820810 RepID=A0ABS4AMY4_9PROT|nr:CmpA/NrtA family ABC transporter substrate-binding protein [Neoroseomonas nitratireducens]MBP0462713.1 ABC transporter substrate-binding protein [Neoroseomonas nitratireducens]
MDAPPLRIGYVPLTDAAPLVVADALGFFAAAGLRVVLSPERAWATLRDKLAFGVLDAAHLLGPMAVALAVGAGGLKRRLDVTLRLGRNGNCLVLSHALADAAGAVAPPLPAAAFAAALHARAEEGLPPPTLGVVFPHSSHNYLLREWLASGGLDPDHDARLVVVPPPQMARALAEGAIEGFCAGEPWGSHAVALGAGRYALSTGDIWPDHPEKVLAFAEGFALRATDQVVAATAAVIEAQRWLDDPANRPAAAALLAERVFPGMPHATVAAALEGCVAAPPGGLPARLAAPLGFDPDHPPSPATAERWFAAMRRWGHLPAGAAEDAARGPWRPDLWQRAAARLAPSASTPIPQEPAA